MTTAQRAFIRLLICGTCAVGGVLLLCFGHTIGWLPVGIAFGMVTDRVTP